jgi:hypothetical protein
VGHAHTTWLKIPQNKHCPSGILFYPSLGVKVLQFTLRAMGPQWVPLGVVEVYVIGGALWIVLAVHGTSLPLISAEL